MGQMGRSYIASGGGSGTIMVIPHGLNDLFYTNARDTAKKLNRLRQQPGFGEILAPTSDTSKPPPRVRSLRFAASELTRKVNWNQKDVSRGDRRLLLKWLSWVEMDDNPPVPDRRIQAQMIVAALDYFIRAGGTPGAVIPRIAFSWTENVVSNSSTNVVMPNNGMFSVAVNPKITANMTLDPNITDITIAVQSTDVYHTENIGNASEDPDQ